MSQAATGTQGKGSLFAFRSFVAYITFNCELSNKSNIQFLIIESGVKNIGNSTFLACDYLTEVVIPNSVTSIGSFAFSGCNNLVEVVIPNGITSIGDYVFATCKNLKEVVISDSVVSISGSAFSESFSIAEIKVSPDNKNYTDIKGVLFNKDKTELICYPRGKKETKYEIPYGVTSIGFPAFSYCNSLVEVVIPNSVTCIGNWAFSYCDSLAEVVIPNSVTSIGNYTFFHCGLAEIVIPDNVTSIGEGAFFHCSSLAEVVISESVTTIGKRTFSDCDSLAKVVIPSNVTTIDEDAFSDCDNLATIVMNPAVPPKGDNPALPDCCKQILVPPQSVEAYKKDETWREYAERVFANPDYKEEIAVQGECGKAGKKVAWTLTNTGVLAISGNGEMADYDGEANKAPWERYKGCLVSISIENGVKSIGNYSFSNCSRLANIAIPASVTTIGEHAFYDCKSLENVSIPNGATAWNFIIAFFHLVMRNTSFRSVFI